MYKVDYIATCNEAVPEEDKSTIARLLKEPAASSDDIRAVVKELWPKLSPMDRRISQEWVVSKLLNLPKDDAREALERVKASGRSIKHKDFYEAIYKMKVPLVVKTLTGGTIFMYVPNCVFAAYFALHKIEGLVVEQECLIFANKGLVKEVEQPITTICQPGSVFRLVLRLRGGARTSRQARTTYPPQKKAKRSYKEKEEWTPVMPDHHYIQEWCGKEHDEGKKLLAPNFNTLL